MERGRDARTTPASGRHSTHSSSCRRESYRSQSRQGFLSPVCARHCRLSSWGELVDNHAWPPNIRRPVFRAWVRPGVWWCMERVADRIRTGLAASRCTSGVIDRVSGSPGRSRCCRGACGAVGTLSRPSRSSQANTPFHWEIRAARRHGAGAGCAPAGRWRRRHHGSLTEGSDGTLWPWLDRHTMRAPAAFGVLHGGAGGLGLLGLGPLVVAGGAACCWPGRHRLSLALAAGSGVLTRRLTCCSTSTVSMMSRDSTGTRATSRCSRCYSR